MSFGARHTVSRKVLPIIDEKPWNILIKGSWFYWHAEDFSQDHRLEDCRWRLQNHWAKSLIILYTSYDKGSFWQVIKETIKAIVGKMIAIYA